MFAAMVAALAVATTAQSKDMFDGEGSDTRPERLALIIGVDVYQENFPPLKNVANDVAVVSKSLMAIGVDNPMILVGRSRSPFVLRKQIYQQLKEFVRDARDSQRRRGVPPILFFYFAGHGFTHGEYSYVVPSDADITNSEDPDRNAIRVAEIVGILKDAAPALSVVMIDACRDFAFTELRPLGGGGAPTKVTRGIDANKSTPVSNSIVAQPENSSVLLYLSSGPGEPASDGEGKSNGPFALAMQEVLDGAIAQIMRTTDATKKKPNYRFFSEITEDVNRRVSDETRNREKRQTPVLSNAAIARFPILTTRDHFDFERRIFMKIPELIADKASTALPVRGDPDYARKFTAASKNVDEAKHCYYTAYVSEFGYSYYWQQATAEKEKSTSSRCDVDYRLELETAAILPTLDRVVGPDGITSMARVRTTDLDAVLLAQAYNSIGTKWYDIDKSQPKSWTVPWDPRTPGVPVFASVTTSDMQAGVSGIDWYSKNFLQDRKSFQEILRQLGDARVKVAESALTPMSSAKLVVLTATDFVQPQHPGGKRKVTLTPGEAVDFIRFEGAKSEEAYVRHAIHGNGYIHTADLTSARGLFQVIFELEEGGLTLSESQHKLLNEALAQFGSVGQLSSVSIRYPEASGPAGLAAAFEVASMIKEVATRLEHPPRIERSKSLKTDLVEVVAAFDLCGSNGINPSSSRCRLPVEFVQRKSPLKALGGENAAFPELVLRPGVLLVQP